MSSSSAADLLSILRGDKPAPPPPPPQRTLSAASTYHTPLQSSAASMVNVDGTEGQASAVAAGTSGNEGIERLFKAFAQPHPSSTGQVDQAGEGQHGLMPGALPRAQYSSQQPPPTLGKASSGADTASLLSLLRGGGSSGEAPAVTGSAGVSGGATTTDTNGHRPLPAQAPPPMSPQGGTAGELLASLMGGSGTTLGGAGLPPAASPVKTKEELPAKEETKEKKPEKSQPNFSFVSPFDLLDKLQAEDRAKAASTTSASSSQQATQHKPPLSSVPSHLRSPRSAATTSSGGASDADDTSPSASSRPQFASIEQVAGLPPSSSPAPSSTASTSVPRPSTSSASSSALPTHFLASQYLPTASPSSPSASSPLRASFAPPSSSSSTTARRPSYAPSGLRLPRPSLSSTRGQALSITLTEAHLESLAPHPASATPITLMESKGEYVEGEGAMRKAGLWEGGIVYATKKGRVRVIERESGARGLLKLNDGRKKGKGAEQGKDDEVADLRIAPGVKKDQAGSDWRHVAIVSREGRVVVWAVSERFDGDGQETGGEMRSTKILDLPWAGLPLGAPILVRFHPQYPVKPLLAVAFAHGSVALYDVDKLSQQRSEGKLPVDLALGAMERISAEPSKVMDLAFCPDGSAYVVVRSDGTYYVERTFGATASIVHAKIPLPASASSATTGGSSSGTSSTVTPAPVLASLGTAEETETKAPQPSEVCFVFPRTGPSRPVYLAVSFSRGTEVVVFPLSRSPLPGEAVTSLSFPAPTSSSTIGETEKTHYGQLAYHPETQSLVVSSSLRGSFWAYRLAFPSLAAIDPATDAAGDDATIISAECSSLDGPRPVRIDHVLETPLLSGPIVSFALSPSTTSSTESASSTALTTSLDNKYLPPTAVAAAGKTPFDVLVTHLKGIDLVQVVAEKPREYASASRSAAGGVTPSIAGSFAFGNTNPFGVAQVNGHDHAFDGRLPADPDRDHEHNDLYTDEDADEFDRAMAAGRRMSLEGSIYVSSEVEVCVEEPDHWEREHAEERGEHWDGDRKGREEAGMNGFGADNHPEDREASIDEPALGDLGAAGLTVTPIVEVAPPHTASSFATAPSSPHSSFNLHPHAPPKSPKRSASGSSLPQQEAEVIRELRRIEQGFRGEIGKIVRAELEKHVHHLEEDRLHALESITAREETLLKLALQAAKKDTSRVVENAVKEQVQKYVGPVVKEAVRGEVGRGIDGAIRQVLSAELDKQLSRPDIVFPLSASIATTIAPPLERSLTNALMSAVVPSFERNLSTAVDGLVNSIHQEMLDVRKEIVQEQSGAVAVLEDEVSGLKSEVAGLRAQMEQMLQLLMAQRLAPPEGSPRMGHHPQLREQHHHQPHRTAPSAAAVATGTNALSPTSSHPPYHQGLPASISSTSLASVAGGSAGGQGVTVLPGQPLPPIPRSHTPPERYEELFTEAMQPRHEPEFTALVHLINSSPAGRIDAVFPPVGGPRISMAVVLSLAFRLSQVLASRDGRMDEEGRRMLAWLRRAVTACDGKVRFLFLYFFTPASAFPFPYPQPPEFHAMIPRILTQVLDHLVARGRQLAMIGDSAGVNEIKVIEQYARARLSLFSQGGGEGPEGFRR
ncbi:hypothetical protein JCM11251_000778 [Rhodosporidiobolus azoricus]